MSEVFTSLPYCSFLKQQSVVLTVLVPYGAKEHGYYHLGLPSVTSDCHCISTPTPGLAYADF